MFASAPYERLSRVHGTDAKGDDGISTARDLRQFFWEQPIASSAVFETLQDLTLAKPKLCPLVSEMTSFAARKTFKPVQRMRR